MITVRSSHERGHAQHGWLNSRHTFSFSSYYDPNHMGVSVLRVINDDWVKPGYGFDVHPHRDMEIISYVLKGSIEHKDTLGMHSTLKAGEIQVMSAGTGIFHSEYNPSKTEELNFLQIWIQPNKMGVEPRYAQKDYSNSKGVTLVVSPNGEGDSLPINQNANVYKVDLNGESESFSAREELTYYLHVAKGNLKVNGITMTAGDGASIMKEMFIGFEALDQVEALLFELP